MSASNRNHIYKYDHEKRKVIIIDAETGEEIKRRDGKLDTLLKYLAHKESEEILRKFAIWCARQPDEAWKPVIYEMFRTAEGYLYGDISLDRMETLYRDTEGIAISTDSVGLRQGDLKAPLLLAARACINPDPYQAATEASRYYKLWCEMNYKYQNKDLSEEDAEEVNQNMLTRLTQRQVDYLLELMALKQ